MTVGFASREQTGMPPTKDADGQAIANLVDKYINENDVMIFSKSWCPYCNKVKRENRSLRQFHRQAVAWLDQERAAIGEDRILFD